MSSTMKKHTVYKRVIFVALALLSVALVARFGVPLLLVMVY